MSTSIPQSSESSPMEHYDNPMLNDMSWGNEYSPSVDSWLQTNADWPMFDTDLTSSPTTEMYIQPQVLNMYNSPSSTNSSSRTRNISNFSDVASSATTSLDEEDDEEDITPKQESICAPSPAVVAAPPRKRGRPRTVRIPEENAYENEKKSPKSTKRQPHNQVERKYREGLNAELERLRLALPTARWEMTNAGSGVKASKAAVLAGAVAYIRDLEQERDLLRRENEMLKSGRGMRSSFYE